MNEYNYRNQVNVIYGAPCEVVAAGHNRNLVQGAQPKERKNWIEDLDKILNFTRFPGEKKSTEKPESEIARRKKITQAAMPNIDSIMFLDKVLRFGRNDDSRDL